MNWQSFRALHEIYEFGKTKFRPTLANDSVFKYHAYQSRELLFTRKEIIDTKANLENSDFKQTFKNLYLNRYNECLSFLESMELNTPQCRFEIEDILILKDMKQQMAAGQLDEIREQIIQFNETRKGISLMFFKNEKYLKGKEALEDAVKLILNIEKFADDRDLQYLYVLHCISPKSIILCENLNFLRIPEKTRENQLEMWFAGGRNIEKLAFAERRNLPIYYSCDWDYDGLDIFHSVKNIIPEIRLLMPNGVPRDIIKTEHKSLWKKRENPSFLSGLNLELFSKEQKDLIQKLIKENSWIIEESNNLVEMLKNIETN